MEFVQPIKSKDDIEKMKNYLKSKSLRNWALFTLGINSALRISDLLSLKVDDVMDENGKIRERIKVKEIKTKKRKDFPFTNKVKEALTEYITIEKPTDSLFPSQKSSGIKGSGIVGRSQMNKILSDAAIAIGIKENIGSHSMRKSWAFHALDNGVPLVQIMYALNHSSERMTMKYLGLTQDGLDEVYLDLDL
jgi:integrase